jgi:hypothetical protein
MCPVGDVEEVEILGINGHVRREELQPDLVGGDSHSELN